MLFRNTILVFGSLLHFRLALAVNLTELEHYWSYGQSPPVYPSPIGAGLGSWADAYAKARAIVSQMTNEEKTNLTSGYDSYSLAYVSGCPGLTFDIPRLGIPGLCFADAGNGLRGTDLVNAYPSGIHVAASWNTTLAREQAFYIGKEYKAKGVNVINGPVVSPIGRIALGGRNWEGYGPDPYLSGVLVSQTIEGFQQSAIAAVKHFVGYEQETQRSGVDGGNASYSSNIDDKTMHELYLWPFMDAVHAGAGAVMASYNRLNNSYASQNSKALNGLLKTELGFQGFVVSDWSGSHTGVAAASAGLDIAMPNSSYWHDHLPTAVANGTLDQSRLDDMATRIMAAWYKLAPFPKPGFGLPSLIGNIESPSQKVDARDPASKDTIFQGAVEGHVLVKNINNALPLSFPKIISVFGYDAGLAPRQNPPLSLSWYLGYTSVNVTDSFNLGSLVDYPDFPSAATRGTLISGGGSGATSPSYVSTPLGAIMEEAAKNGAYVVWDLESINPTVLTSSDVCLVFINEFATEQIDRRTLADPASDELVNNVAKQCTNTIVSVHNAGIRVVDAWVENPNVTAVIFSHLPGQDSGRALSELLFGRQSPSGRLPYTVAKSPEDYGALLIPDGVQADHPYYPQSNFTEGVYIDYKSFIQRNVTPRFEFGYGLTYTAFTYSNITASLKGGGCLSAYPPGAAVAEGGLPSLWDTVATVDVVVTNTGNFTASEVAQLYLGIPDGPPKVLRGFSKVRLTPGQSADVTFNLTRRDLSSWDVVKQSWLLQTGTYDVQVGASVLDVRLSTHLQIGSTARR